MGVWHATIHMVNHIHIRSVSVCGDYEENDEMCNRNSQHGGQGTHVSSASRGRKI